MVVDLVDDQQKHNYRGDDYADQYPASGSLAIRNLNGGTHTPSLAVEDEPQQATEKKNDGRIEKYDWLDRRLKLTAHKKHA
jgi:hypothetical protein